MPWAGRWSATKTRQGWWISISICVTLISSFISFSMYITHTSLCTYHVYGKFEHHMVSNRISSHLFRGTEFDGDAAPGFFGSSLEKSEHGVLSRCRQTWWAGKSPINWGFNGKIICKWEIFHDFPCLRTPEGKKSLKKANFVPENMIKHWMGPGSRIFKLHCWCKWQPSKACACLCWHSWDKSCISRCQHKPLSATVLASVFYTTFRLTKSGPVKQRLGNTATSMEGHLEARDGTEGPIACTTTILAAVLIWLINLRPDLTPWNMHAKHTFVLTDERTCVNCRFMLSFRFGKGLYGTMFINLGCSPTHIITHHFSIPFPWLGKLQKEITGDYDVVRMNSPPWFEDGMRMISYFHTLTLFSIFLEPLRYHHFWPFYLHPLPTMVPGEIAWCLLVHLQTRSTLAMDTCHGVGSSWNLKGWRHGDSHGNHENCRDNSQGNFWDRKPVDQGFFIPIASYRMLKLWKTLRCHHQTWRSQSEIPERKPWRSAVRWEKTHRSLKGVLKPASHGADYRRVPNRGQDIHFFESLELGIAQRMAGSTHTFLCQMPRHRWFLWAFNMHMTYPSDIWNIPR